MTRAGPPPTGLRWEGETVSALLTVGSSYAPQFFPGRMRRFWFSPRTPYSPWLEHFEFPSSFTKLRRTGLRLIYATFTLRPVTVRSASSRVTTVAVVCRTFPHLSSIFNSNAH